MSSKKLTQRGCEHISIPKSPATTLSKRRMQKAYKDFNPGIVVHLAARFSGIGANRKNPGSSMRSSCGNLAQNRWAVKGFISDTATISDLLRNGKVECSSCHDPHFRNLSWDEAEPTWSDEGGLITYCTAGEDCSDGNFLRRIGGNTGSGVCRTCHEK